ncbi:MAG: long-chain fatty acid--CoA ligase [Candidatus Rokuibacteriota bacterium]|nr:MAG: long-chain fatty acid--CoA ligase [Candidatus Rokubacteria bacterium]
MDFSRLRASTIPGLLVERARARPARVAFRAKELGVYRETTWAALAARVAAVAQGLAARFGVGRGSTVAILGDPCPEWTIADLAAQALGAVTYGIYPTSAPGEVRYLLEHGGARVVIVEDQEHLDKTLAVLDDAPGVRGVIVVDTRALFMYRSTRVHRFADIEAAGRALAPVDALARLAAGVRPDDAATIVYTSGTTGHPKGALYRHGQHLAACANILAHYPILTDGEHRVVAMLPLCHTMGRNTVITMPLLADIVPHYPESLATVAESLYEVAPTFVFTVPRYLQKFAAHLLVGIDASTTLKRAAYHAALRLGARAVSRGATALPGRDERGGVWGRLSRGATALPGRDERGGVWGAISGPPMRIVARGLVFRWLLEKVGFARVRLLISSGAPLPPAVATLWQVWGVNLCEAYGQTETGGALVSGQRGPYPRPGDVGAPAPNVEVALGDDGELRVRGPDLFAGYWRDPEATSAAYRDGWLLTGDVAERTAEGALRLVDRRKDLVITAGGKNVSPSQIETGLRASPYVSDAVVFGEGRKYLAALIEMDYETVAEWARERGLTHTGYASLAAHPEVTRLLDAEIARANASFGRVEQVKTFRVLPRELDPEQEGEPVTPTRKVKRRLMLERYHDLVESMFASDEERRITAEVAALTRDKKES